MLLLVRSACEYHFVQYSAPLSTLGGSGLSNHHWTVWVSESQLKVANLELFVHCLLGEFQNLVAARVAAIQTFVMTRVCIAARVYFNLFNCVESVLVWTVPETNCVGLPKCTCIRYTCHWVIQQKPYMYRTTFPVHAHVPVSNKGVNLSTCRWTTVPSCESFKRFQL